LAERSSTPDGRDEVVELSPAAATPAVTIREVTRRFGDVVALDGVSLDVRPGEFLSILGPSGCGKTTLLRIIGGFEVPDSGFVEINGARMARVPSHRRPVNTVFQRYALFPHMSVGQNVAFGLNLRRRPKAQTREKVESMLRLVRLDGYADRMPSQLSGGQAQRVALARALANDPVVLLLDEPLAALDLKLRQAMHVELREIQRTVGSTFVYVTHDQEEALSMSDRVTLMNEGHVEQIGPPIEVYRNPRSRFVSSFIGEANLFDGTVVSLNPSTPSNEARSVLVSIGTQTVEAPHAAEVTIGQTINLCVRPEAMELRRPGEGSLPNAANGLPGKVRSTVFLGPFVRYLVEVGDERVVMVQADAGAEKPIYSDGDEVVVAWPTSSATLIPDEPP
jgi:spermidine/putrescine transport system ATP-binding protein